MGDDLELALKDKTLDDIKHSLPFDHPIQIELEEDDLKQVVRRFLEICNSTEISDSGKEFSPVLITSCRVEYDIELGKLLCEMERLCELA